MVTVEGKVLNVKPKQTREGTEYQGVTFERGSDGAKFWFGNYSGETYKRGEQIRVTADSTGEGNNITFLNRIKTVERERGAMPAPAPSAAALDDGSPEGVHHAIRVVNCPFNGGKGCWTCRPKSAEELSAAAAAPPTPAASATGWEDPSDVDIPAAAPPAAEVTHSVTENAAPLGTLDDLADGVDPSRYGGVIVFRKGTTKSEVEFLLRAIAGVLAASDVREYDEKGGAPAFYIP